MKKIFQIILVALFLIPVRAWSLDVVPWLKVYGGKTRAAYGNNTNPTICIVNSLNPYAPIQDSTRNGVPVNTGGFKRFLDWDQDNKVILFEVSGTITHYGYLFLDNNYVTIAGQTAPSPGICIKGATFYSCGHDILIQHLRFRPGDGDDEAQVEKGNRDAFDACTHSYCGEGPYNVVVDHCSFSWATDENANMGGAGAHDITFINCIISHGLANAGHPKVEHSKGTCLSTGNNLMLANCLFAHNNDRGPYIVHGPGQYLVANNIIYNPGIHTNISVEQTSGDTDISALGNLIIHGNDSTTSTGYKLVHWFIDITSSSEVHLEDNRVDVYGGGTYTQNSANDWSKTSTSGKNKNNSVETTCKVTSTPFPYPPGYTPMASTEVESYIATNVGARPADRDAYDTQIVLDFQNGTGRVIDSQSDVGGWPTLPQNTRTLSIPSDPHGDDDNDGYTNLEEWLHQLAVQVEGRSAEPSSQPPSPPTRLRFK